MTDRPDGITAKSILSNNIDELVMPLTKQARPQIDVTAPAKWSSLATEPLQAIVYEV
ncbi:hypothetical protein [Trinickia dabaoshanensis]|uniref:hypothetical protein n=1 Tax=Trinickia dabaoshanensis TaxID=564714 RepID=UPI001304C935|nr:hypothetical protein [Trinickia dabaoshanensis]